MSFTNSDERVSANLHELSVKGAAAKASKAGDILLAHSASCGYEKRKDDRASEAGAIIVFRQDKAQKSSGVFLSKLPELKLEFLGRIDPFLNQKRVHCVNCG